jgi:hypothetical protein
VVYETIFQIYVIKIEILLIPLLQAMRMTSHSTGGKFAVADLKIAGASENFVLNY